MSDNNTRWWPLINPAGARRVNTGRREMSICSPARRRSLPGWRKWFNVYVSELNRLALCLQANGAGSGGQPRRLILQNAIYANRDGVAATSNFRNIPFPDGLFRTRQPTRQAVGIGVGKRGQARSAIEAQFAGTASKQPRLEAQRPDLVGWIHMHEDATVARTSSPAPFDVQLTVPIRLQRACVAVGFAEAGNHTIRHRLDGRRGCVRCNHRIENAGRNQHRDADGGNKFHE